MSDFKAKMHQFDFRWGSASDPAGGDHNTPPDPLAGFKGILLLREERERSGEGAGKGKK